MKQRILLIFMWVMFPLCLTAQGNFPLVQIQISDLLQYQAQKIKRTIPSSFFSKYGFQQIRTELLVGSTDTRQLWGWHVGPNPNFNSLQQPLYRLFEKKDDSSIAIVDDKDGHLQILSYFFTRHATVWLPVASKETSKQYSPFSTYGDICSY